MYIKYALNVNRNDKGNFYLLSINVPRKYFVVLKRNKSHGLGGMHLKYIIKTNHVQLKSRISRMWFTQNVFKKLENPVISPNDRGLTC